MTAEETSPLWRRLVELVPALQIAQADETTMRVLAKHKTRAAYLWTFLGRDADDKEIVAYQFSPTRSGETPVRVLGDSRGKVEGRGRRGRPSSKSARPGGIPRGT